MGAFRLTRYFSLVSLALLVIASSALSLLMRSHEIDQMQNMAEKRNKELSLVFRHLLSDEIQILVAARGQAGSAEASALENIQRRISPLLRDSDITKLKIYRPDGTVVFSTDTRQIGDNKWDNSGFQVALSGGIQSELVHRAEISQFEGETAEADLLSSYIPVLENDRVVAVLELYQNVTLLIRDIQRQVWMTLSMVLAILGPLYFLQLIVVHHAQRILQNQSDKLMATNRDLDSRVSERSKEISELLRHQQVIFDNTQVGILLLKNRVILRANKRMAEMFGFSTPEELIGQRTEIFYGSPEAFERAGAIGYMQLRERGAATFETRMYRRDGSEIWVMQTGRPVNPESVLEDVSIWVYTDISEIKRSQSEQAIAAAAFDSQEGMFVTDEKLVILRINKAFSEMTGYSAEDIVGKTPRILQSGRHDAAFYQAIWKSIHETGSWSGEVWNKRKNGEIFADWLTISAVRSSNGEICNYVATHTDITERKHSEDRITQLAFFDQLTRLPNRTLLMDRLRQALLACERSRNFGAVLFLDLDHFKSINDTVGHEEGDKLLIDVASKLGACIRQCDTLARLGGDEFIIVLTDIGESAIDAAACVETIGHKLLSAASSNFLIHGIEFRCSASIGVTLFHGAQTSPDELLKQADLAMYRSKDAGRNCLTFFDQGMGEAVVARLLMEAELRHALQEEQFVLHYQAQASGDNLRIVGAEVLVRWQHPTQGLVYPDKFITAAEESGQIVALGLWVLESACFQLAKWSKSPALNALTLAVNISIKHFTRDDFVAQVTEVLQKTQAPANKLKLELTESLFVEDTNQAIAKMNQLKAFGVGFSLDDFGTGYSSLALLSRLPLDQIKIDRSFVGELGDSDINAAICAATIGLAHNLKVDVVAEGVELEMQKYFLATVHGCDLLQGYLISRPIPLAEFESLCLTQTRERSAGIATESSA